MLLVSRPSKTGNGRSTTAARVRLGPVTGLHADRRVATKFWHIDCVSPARAPRPVGPLSRGTVADALREHINERRNFRRAGSLAERTLETVKVDGAVD